MKQCSVCGFFKPDSDYQKRAASKDGLASACKPCIQERDRKRYQEKEKSLRAERQREYVKTVRGKEASDEAKRAYIIRNKAKRIAHSWVSNAIRDGRLIPLPCEVCGKEPSEAHHPDYNQPTVVQWLCTYHHAELHRLEREAQRLTREIARKGV